MLGKRISVEYPNTSSVEDSNNETINLRLGVFPIYGKGSSASQKDCLGWIRK